MLKLFTKVVIVITVANVIFFYHRNMKLIKLQKIFTLYIIMGRPRSLAVIPVFAIATLTLDAPSMNANGTESGNYTYDNRGMRVIIRMRWGKMFKRRK